ncbi:MAG: flagellar filament capping protein FliD, partial [Acidimicrobiales bacterium]
MTVASTGSGSQIVVNGLISGITTPKVIQALLAGYQAPITSLTEQQASLEAEAGDYRTLSTDFQAVLTDAQTLARSSQWDLATATTSKATVATAIAAAGAQTGSLTFTVNQLAQANVLASSAGVSSEGQVVTSAPSLLVATGAAAIGFSSLGAGAGLAIGSHVVTVTQASASAQVTGTTAVAGTVGITSADDVISLTVDGSAHTLTLATGTYTPAGLVTAIDAAAKAAGAPVSASLAPTGALRISSDDQGSKATLTVTGGSALPALGLSSGQKGTGADAVVSVDGTKTTLTSVTAGQVVTLSSGTASISATVASGPDPAGALIGTGTAHAADVSTGSGSLSQVVSAINGSGLGATATAVKLSSGAYILQVSANATGTAGSVTLDPKAFTGSPLGTMRTIAQAQDATVSVGGSNGYTLSSSTDTFSDLLPGTAVTAVSTGQATVTVTPDAAGEATRVKSLVTAADKALADIQTYAGYTTASKKGGPLMGAAELTDMKQEILSVFGSVGGTSSLGDLANVGVTLTKTGTIDFTKGKFTTAFAAGPAQVAALFTQGGTYSPAGSANAGEVTFAFAGNDTAAGTYAVNVSHSATQAVDTGSVVTGGSVSAAETLTVRLGSATAVYTTTAGESLGTIAGGLNAAFAGAGVALTAQVVSGTTQLEVVSNGYGSQDGFSVTSTAAGAGTTGLGGATAGVARAVSGTDV